MKQISRKQVKNAISEAFEAFRINREKLNEEFRAKFPNDPEPDMGYYFPYLPGPDLIGAEISRNQGTQEKSAEQIEWRLRQVVYPYHRADRNPTKTLHQHVEEVGLLPLLLSAPLIFNIRGTWYIRAVVDKTEEVYGKGHSQYGYPRIFHRRMLWETVRHLQRLDELLLKNNVPGTWIAEYRSRIQSAVLREAAVNFLIPGTEADFSIEPVRISGADLQFDLFQEISKALKPKNNLLVYHIIGALFSSEADLQKGELKPTPATVSRNIRQLRKKQ